MSSTVCQGLQSCLEHWLVEPRAKGLKLAPPRAYFTQAARTRRPSVSALDTEDHDEQCNNKKSNNDNTSIYDDQRDNNSHDKDKVSGTHPISSNCDLGNWSFIQALAHTSETTLEAKEKETHYVHPLIKRSSSTLSEKSLELCTESLGSETGTDITEYNSFLSSSSDTEGAKPPPTEEPRSRQLFEVRKQSCHNFPPPLTSISGTNCVHFKPHREGGRLVIKAITVPSPRTCFQAERSDGRLRLHFVKNCHPTSDARAAEEEFQGNNEEEDAEEEEEEVEGEEEEEPEEVNVEEEEEEEEDEEECDLNLSEELYGNNGNAGSEMGIGNFQRPSRCKEGGRGNKLLLIREACWVATS